VIQAPVALPLLLLFLLAVGLFIVVVEIRALADAYRVIGISPRYVSLVLLLTLLGREVSHPVTAGADEQLSRAARAPRGRRRFPARRRRGRRAS
jgi:uncharacterized membrane protein